MRAADIVQVVGSHHGLWMTWNTFLALVPLGLALILFQRMSRAAHTTLLCEAWREGISGGRTRRWSSARRA
jgi:uncharacterized membrane protein